MSMVWESYPAGGSEILALLALADWSDDQGLCFPSIAAIASKTRLSRSQAQRVVHGLIESGFVAVEGNAGGGAPGATRRYRIQLDRLTGSVSATGSANATGSVDAADGSHPCGETGSTHATQTVIEPSITTRESGKPAPAGIADPCPHQEIIAAYHRLLPMGRQVREWTPARASTLRSRWREKSSRQSLDWWERFFAYVALSPFLKGQVPSKPGHRPFELSLDWLVKAENMAKVIEGAYHDAQDAAQEDAAHA